MALAQTVPPNMTLDREAAWSGMGSARRSWLTTDTTVEYIDTLHRSLDAPPNSPSLNHSPESSTTAHPVHPAINIRVLVMRLEKLESRITALEDRLGKQ